MSDRRRHSGILAHALLLFCSRFVDASIDRRLTTSSSYFFSAMDIIGAPRTSVQIPCCLCGTMIFPNAANQCGVCLATQYNLGTIVQRGPSGHDLCIYQCRKCRRFRHSDTYWIECSMESPELLTLCLKHTPALQPHSRQLNQDRTQSLKNIASIQLKDAMWIWTEPHSMRLKMALTVHAQVGESAKSVVVQQRIPVEYKIQFQMCPECNREYTNRTWHAVVQLRQRGGSSTARKGLVLLEMYIAKHAELKKDILSVQTTRNGFDFYFLELLSAQALVSHLSKIYPMKVKTSSKMVSEDVKNNTKNMKYTLLCDLVPLSTGDMVMWDMTEGQGRSSSHNIKFCLVFKLAGSIHLVNLSSSHYGNVSMDHAMIILSPERYWKLEKQIHVVGSSKRLIRFIVLDVELLDENLKTATQYHDSEDYDEGKKLYTGPSSGVEKYRFAQVQIAREEDMGKNNEILTCTTHLGNLLQAGDIVLGYDVINSVMTGAEEWLMEDVFESQKGKIPDVVLVKKVTGVDSYGSTSRERDGHKNKMNSRKSKKVNKTRGRKTRDKKTRDVDEEGLDAGDMEEEIEQDSYDFQEERLQLEDELRNDPLLVHALTAVEMELLYDDDKMEEMESKESQLSYSSD